MILANAVHFRAIVSLFAFVDVHLAEITVPSVLALALASIEIAHALSVLAVDTRADVVERAVVDLNVFHLFDDESVRAELHFRRLTVVERHVEILTDQDVLQTATKAIADEYLGLSFRREQGFQREIRRVGGQVIDRQRGEFRPLKIERRPFFERAVVQLDDQIGGEDRIAVDQVLAEEIEREVVGSVDVLDGEQMCMLWTSTQTKREFVGDLVRRAVIDGGD